MNDWRELIVDLIIMLPQETEMSLDEMFNKAMFRISREQVLNVLLMAAQEGYIEAVWVNGRPRFCSTKKGRDYAVLWFE